MRETPLMAVACGSKSKGEQFWVWGINFNLELNVCFQHSNVMFYFIEYS